jgi:hypothetical protein
MPPEIRRASEQKTTLPGIQTPYVADTTAPARAMIEIGRGLQQNTAFAQIGNALEQRSNRSVEEAYMRYSSANNAHLNGGAYNLSDDPEDQYEGGGFITKRGKLAQGSDEEYRKAMDGVRDTLTKNMSARERTEFDKMTFRLKESGLASLRHNITAETMRYDTELVDATLKSAADSNLTQALKSYQQMQSFNGGALDIAGREAMATGDTDKLAANRDAVAKQSETDAIRTVNEWYNGNLQEINRAADFMRAQGMDEKTIDWRAKEFLSHQAAGMAQTLMDNGMIEYADKFIANAEQVGLSPNVKPALAARLDNAKAGHLANMMGLAKSETDLDKQETLLQAAEQTARTFNVDGKLLGTITEETGMIRSKAQRMEAESALQTLVDGKTYIPGDNERMKSALKMAQPKFEELKRKELNRTLTGNKEYIAGMIGAGAWLDPEGNVTAVDTESQKSILRSALYDGQIRIPDFNAQMSKIKSVELSGKKEQHLKAAAEICTVLGTEIKAIWKDSSLALDEKTDPNKKLSSFSITETETKLVDEMAPGSNAGTYTGVGFIPSTSKPTGRKIEQTIQIKKKREILSKDIPKLANLLIAADSADGLLVDLDGNPATPATKVERQKFKEQLFRDIKNKVMAVDIDTQAKGIFEALSKRARDNSVLEATAISKNAGLNLPADEAKQSEQNNDN